MIYIENVTYLRYGFAMTVMLFFRKVELLGLVLRTATTLAADVARLVLPGDIAAAGTPLGWRNWPRIH